MQAEVVRLREDRGEKIIGYQVGCTSRLIQEQLGVKEPIFGRLCGRDLVTLHSDAVAHPVFVRHAWSNTPGWHVQLNSLTLESSMAMRMPRVRFTVWRMMIALALVSVVFGIARMLEAHRSRLKMADSWQAARLNLLASPDRIKYWEDRWTVDREGKPASYPWPARPPFVPAIAAHYDAMRIKWEQAARYPWLSVEPDSTEK